MYEESDNKSLTRKERKTDDLKRKEAINEILRQYPSILQITSISYKESESNIRQERPTVRCVHDIKIKDLIKKVVNEEWKLKSPRIVVLIMSNMGSIHNWTNAKQIKNFQKGLMKAADNTNMWVITNGIDIGATNMIGNAVSDYLVETKYKRVSQKEKSYSQFNFIGVADENVVKYLPTITASDELKVEITEVDTTSSGDKFRLNHNLSHYILIKDNTEDKKHGINDFLENLSKFLSSSLDEAQISLGENKDDRITIETTVIPLVSLIIKGGFGCSQLVLNQINNQIPVVVLKGTGGLADLMAFVDMEMRDRFGFDDWEPEFVETHLKPELTARIFGMFPQYRTNESELIQFRDRILESVRRSRTRDGQSFLTVINLYDTYTCHLEDLTEILLSALFKAQRVDTPSSEAVGSTKKRDTIKRDLTLCVDWNCPEVAKKEVLTKDPTFALNDEKRLFEEALIRKNRCDFVDLFLSQKFRLRSFLTPKRLKRMFRKIHSNEFFSSVCWEGVLGRTPGMRQSERFIERELNWLMEACTGNSIFFDESELSLFVTGQYPGSEREAERKSLEVLVLWGVFHFRKRLVRLLWRNSDRPINLALIIAMCYERLSWYANEQSLNDELKAESKQFLSFALTVLDKCYKESASRSENVLNESPKDWNYKTPVDVAAFGRFRQFFSHPSCQRWLTNRFYGNIAVKDLRGKWYRLPSLAKILLSAYLIFPVYWWIKITNIPKNEDEDEEEDEDDDETHKKKGETTKTSNIESKTIPKKDESDSKLETTDNTTEGTPQNKKEKEEQEKKPEIKAAPEPSSTATNEVVANKKSPVIYQPPIWRVIYEVWTAPITKFWNFQFFYTFYLSIFSVALLYQRCGNFYLDVVVAVWTALLLLDDIRQTYVLSYTNSNVSISSRAFEMFLKFSFLMLFVISRLRVDSSFKSGDSILSPYSDKFIMCLGLLHAFQVLLIKFLPISATLGPLLYRLKIMLLVDFLNFIRLSILVMISFGVVIQAILYPDQVINYELFRQAFHRAFFSLFLTPTDELLVKDNCKNKTLSVNDTLEDQCYASIYSDSTCAVTGWAPYIFVIVYFILLKLILLTLLFALFASSASTLTSDTDAIWKFQRYGLVLDFASRGPVPPPFNIFYYIYIVFKSLCNFQFKNIRAHNFKFTAFTLSMLHSKSRPQTRHLSDDEYNYFKLLASETFDEFQNKQSADTISALQWERIQALSQESEFQRQSLRQLKARISEMDTFLKSKLNEPQKQQQTT